MVRIDHCTKDDVKVRGRKIAIERQIELELHFLGIIPLLICKNKENNKTSGIILRNL